MTAVNHVTIRAKIHYLETQGMKTSLIAIAILVATIHASLANAAQPVKTPVTGQGFVGDFYSIEGPQKKLGILLLGGSEGGKPDKHLAEFFASAGFPVLTLAYFKLDGLPESLEMVPLEYFDKPIAWLGGNEKIKRGGVVVVGASVGGELALLLASTKPEINGVIALAPSSVVWQGLPKQFWPTPPARSSWSIQGKPAPYVPFDSAGYDFKDPLAIYNLYKRSLTQKEAVEKATIEVEKIRGPLLLLSGRDDKLWPSTEMSAAICDRLKDKAFKHTYEHVAYDDAGHTLNEYFMVGGTQEGNRRARESSAKKMLEFLNMLDSK